MTRKRINSQRAHELSYALLLALWVFRHNETYKLTRRSRKEILAFFDSTYTYPAALINADEMPTYNELLACANDNAARALINKKIRANKVAENDAKTRQEVQALLDEIKAKEAAIKAEKEAFYAAHPNLKPDLFNC